MSAATRPGLAGLTTIRTVGALIPADLLARIVAGTDLPGLTADDYRLELGVSPREAANRAWSVLTGAWTAYRDALATRPESDRATGLTRDKWLSVVLRELNFGRVPATPAGGIQADGRSFPISHEWRDVPVHLLGWGVDLDRKTPGVPGAADRAPHAMVQELLNRSDEHLWAMLANGGTLRLLRDSSSLVGQSYVEFDLQAMFDGEVFSDFAVLFFLCHQTRFEPVGAEAGPGGCWLERWRADAVETGARALGALRVGVQHAIEALGTGFIQHPANVELRRRIEGDLTLADFHRALLRLAYRLLFCFVAEDRGLLLDRDADPLARQRYTDWFSTARLRHIAVRRRGTRHADLWQGLSIVIDGLGKEGGRPELGLSGLGGLFEHGPVDVVAGAQLSNDALLAAVRHLCVIQPPGGGPKRTVDYHNLGAEELGGIYESLLEFVPSYDPVDRTFSLESLVGNERKTSGAYYTPTSLIDCLLDSALDPVIDQAERSDDPEAALLGLTVCDPACGSGHFLVAAARRIAARLARVRAEGGEPTVLDAQRSMHDVVARCVYGVDLNPMAAELAKVSLWLEAQQPGRPLSFLDAHIKTGNSLLGTTPTLLAAGIPDEAFTALDGDDKRAIASLRKLNKAQRAGQGDLFANAGIRVDNLAFAEAAREVDAMGGLSLADVHVAQRRQRDLEGSPELRRARLVADAWCAAFVTEKAPGRPVITQTDLVSLERGDGSSEHAVHLAEHVSDLAAKYRFFHWHLEFPAIFPTSRSSDPGPGDRRRGGFTCVVGNPPFLSPLTVSGSKVTAQRTLTKAARGGTGGPKADESSYFLLLASELAGPHGRIGIVLPDSLLSSSDSAPIRAAIGHRHDLCMIWRGDGSEFEASVTTILVALGPMDSCDRPRRLRGPQFDPIGADVVPPWRSGSWSPLVASADAGADVLLSGDRPTMDQLCVVTADYRDQYYGLRGAVFDAEPDEVGDAKNPPLVTTGLIDPLACLWGYQSTKFDKVTYRRPLVRVELLSPSLQKWARSRLVPKLLIATQGKMVEVLIDASGVSLPCVPVISVFRRDASSASLAELAAIFLSPAAFEYFRMTKLGSGLSTGAIKVSAADLRNMPAPVDFTSVTAAAGFLDRIEEVKARAEFRRLMNRAYALPAGTGDAWEATLAAYLLKSSPTQHVLTGHPAGCA